MGMNLSVGSGQVRPTPGPVSDASRRARRITTAVAMPNAEITSAWLSVGQPLLLVLCAVLLWGASLRDINLRAITDVGLVSVLPVSFFVSLGVLTGSFCLTVHRRQAYVPVLLLHLVVLIFIIHGTPALLYEAPRYSWLYKHVGVVDYFQRHGNLDILRRGGFDSNLYIYFNWPSFFALSALITEVAGFQSALSFAGWEPQFFKLLYLGALLLIFRTFTADRRLIWLSVWFFNVTSWIGQDYFAPQAFGYFLHLVILGICLRWFGMTVPLSKAMFRRWLTFAPLISLFRRITSGTTLDVRQADPPPPLQRVGLLFRQAVSPVTSHDSGTGALRPHQGVGLMMIVVLLYGVITSSHQLTPFMTLAAVTA
ncbi:MAG: hypothetical protein M3325_15935, partial [Actinomycetota bacterium]|nr:hypothetical protein [Actinomycetota bacterium]